MITKELLLKIAKLAHLRVKDAEVEEFRSNLSSIFDYMSQLEKIEVKDVAPMSHVLGATNVFRKDEVIEGLSIDDVQKNAPDTSGRFIRVPIIIEQGGEH